MTRRTQKEDPPGKIPVFRRRYFQDDESDECDSSVEISDCSSNMEEDDTSVDYTDDDLDDYDEFGGDSDEYYARDTYYMEDTSPQHHRKRNQQSKEPDPPKNGFAERKDPSKTQSFGGYKGGMETMLAEAVAKRDIRIANDTTIRSDTIQNHEDVVRRPKSPVVTKAYVGGMEAMLAEAIAKREARMKQKTLNSMHSSTAETMISTTLHDTLIPKDSTSSSIPSNSESTASSMISWKGDGMEAMLAVAIAKREKRKQDTLDRREKVNESVEIAISPEAMSKRKLTGDKKSSGHVYMGSMAGMLADAVAKRKERIEKADGGTATIVSSPVNHTLNDNDEPNDDAGELSIAEMAVKAAIERAVRVGEKEDLGENENQLGDDDNDDKEKHKETHRKTFVSVAEEAATYGRLVRLQEKVVEAQGNKKKRHPLANDTWSGPKLRTDDRRSSAMRAIQEAAAVGRMKRLSGEHNKDVYGGYDSEESNFDVDNQVDDQGRKIARTNFLLEKHIKATAHEKKDRMWSDSDAIGDRDQKTSQYKSFDDVCLPTQVLPTFDRIVGKRGKKNETYSNGADLAVIAMRMAEKNQEKQMDSVSSNMEPEITVGRLRVLESISSAVASSAWERQYRLQKPKAELKVTRRCLCPYCKDPTPYQTHKYKRLMYPERFANDEQEYENHVAKAAAEARLASASVHSEHGGKVKKKTIRIVRKRKKHSTGAGKGGTTTTRRVIDGTALTPDELQQLTMHLQKQGATNMSTDELLQIAQKFTGDRTDVKVDNESEGRKGHDSELSTNDLLQTAEELQDISSPKKEAQSATEASEAENDVSKSSPSNKSQSRGRKRESRSKPNQNKGEMRSKSREGGLKKTLRGLSPRPGRRSASTRPTRRSDSISNTEHSTKEIEKSSRRGRLRNPLRGISRSISEHVPRGTSKEPRRGLRFRSKDPLPRNKDLDSKQISKDTKKMSLKGVSRKLASEKKEPSPRSSQRKVPTRTKSLPMNKQQLTTTRQREEAAPSAAPARGVLRSASVRNVRNQQNADSNSRRLPGTLDSKSCHVSSMQDRKRRQKGDRSQTNDIVSSKQSRNLQKKITMVDSSPQLPRRQRMVVDSMDSLEMKESSKMSLGGATAQTQTSMSDNEDIVLIPIKQDSESSIDSVDLSIGSSDHSEDIQSLQCSPKVSRKRSGSLDRLRIGRISSRGRERRPGRKRENQTFHSDFSCASRHSSDDSMSSFGSYDDLCTSRHTTASKKGKPKTKNSAKNRTKGKTWVW